MQIHSKPYKRTRVIEATSVITGLKCNNCRFRNEEQQNKPSYGLQSQVIRLSCNDD